MKTLHSSEELERMTDKILFDKASIPNIVMQLEKCKTMKDLIESCWNISTGIIFNIDRHYDEYTNNINAGDR